MDKWFKSKWFVRVLSLAFAIMLYVFVNVEANTTQSDSRFTPSSNDETETVEDVPVDIRIDDERYVVSGVPEHVSVSLEGINSILTPTVRQRNFNVFVDLEGLGEGKHTVEIEHENIPKGLSAYIEPKTVDVTIEERETKEFSVFAEFMNKEQLPEGYELGEPEVDPDQVTITSSKSVIDQIAMVKVYIDVADVTEPINKREIPINVYDSQGNTLNVHVEPENILVSVDVHNPSKTVSIDVPTKGKLPDDYELVSLSPNKEEVTIYGTNDVLAEIDNISTEDIDLSEINKSETINTNLKVPEGARIDDDKIKVKVNIEETKEEEADSASTKDDEDTKKKTDKQESESKSKSKSESEMESKNLKESNESTESSGSSDEEEKTDELKSSDKTLENIPIEILNQDDEQEIVFVDPSNAVVDITVEGDEKEIKELKEEDFSAFIDVDGLEEGEHEIPITIEGSSDIHASSSLKDVTIEVNSLANE